MYFASRPIVDGRRGISEVMGALLLIIVAVVAVASLASFVSIAQTNAQNRNQFLTNLKNDNLQVTFAQFNVHFKALTPSSSMHWDNISLTIRNANTQPSRLSQMKIGNLWASKWNQLDGNKFVMNISSGFPAVYGRGVILEIPAKGTLSVFVGFNSTYNQVAPLRNASMSVTLLSIIGNFFTTVYNPPSALGLIGVTSVSYQYYNRDVVSLDGSQSVGLNQSKITSYFWNIRIPLVPIPGHGSCNSTALSSSRPAQFAKVLVIGKVTQFFQESKLPAPLPAPSTLSSYCLTGPFKVSFSAVDSKGLIGNFSSVIVASDPNMAPTATFSASISNPAHTVSGNVATIFGTPPPSNSRTIVTYGSNSTSVQIKNDGSYSDHLNACSAGTLVQVLLNALPAQTLQCL